MVKMHDFSRLGVHISRFCPSLAKFGAISAKFYTVVQLHNHDIWKLFGLPCLVFWACYFEVHFIRLYKAPGGGGRSNKILDFFSDNWRRGGF